MELLSLYHQDCVDGMRNRVKDESVDLIVADPPYFKVVPQKWDYRWRTEEDYIAWSSLWLSEASRVLRTGGSLYLFGYFRMLALLLPHLEKRNLRLRQHLVIDKGLRAISGRATRRYKMFPNVTESILLLYKDPIPFARCLLKRRQKTLGLTAKEINEFLGVKSNGGGMWSLYTGDNVAAQLPTKSIWDKLEVLLDFTYPYERLSPTFHPRMGLTNVWTDIDFYEEKRFHPTQKPQPLLERLIGTSSERGDTVLDPFMGGGAAAVCCLQHGRRYIGFEIDRAYYDLSLSRLESQRSTCPAALSHP